MWLAIAADSMFFVGLVGAFLVLRAGNAELFADHARGLDKRIGDVEIVTLILSSGIMWVAGRMSRARHRRKSVVALLVTLLLGVAFIGERTIEYVATMNHHTVVGRFDPTGPLMVIDGASDWENGLAPGERVIAGYAAPLPVDFDIHTISETDVARLSPHFSEFQLAGDRVQDVRYGPGKNIFFAIWYTLTGAHLVHVGVGVALIGGLLVRLARGKAIARHFEYVGLFWHFVVLIGVVLFALLYTSSSL
jgi:heme/copper-type cytochrome/quinol oxidase subunit 3